VVSNDSNQPIIGVTTYLEQAQTGVWDVTASFLPLAYFAAVTRSGGIAVLLPPQPVDESIAARVITSLDGLIISGGKDVDPARYGQEPHPATDVPRRDRDAWEDALLREALDKRVPFFGICRGLQVLNVTLGGTLHQHLPDVVGSSRYNLGGGVFATNDVRIEHGSGLAKILGHDGAMSVKSYHHQAVDRLAPGLTVSARSDDGTVQAVEITDNPFGLAVQWHPEEDADDLRLFAGLVDAARKRAAVRQVGGAVAGAPVAPGVRS
jgi:putative glutamine amidotransferase